MKPGYIYILSNESMPGVVKIGRTERQPEVRSKELQTTGVPQPFKLEHFVFIEDSHAAERQVHEILESKGLRTSSSREFFDASLTEAIQAVELVTNRNTTSKPDFNHAKMKDLASLASKIQIPQGSEEIDADLAEQLTERLADIARKGYPPALKACAEIFEINCPSSLRFKQYWLEYLELARLESIRHNIASGGTKQRENVGKETAEYIIKCYGRGWLTENDYTCVTEFLVRGDQFQYDGYIQHLRRHKLPTAVMAKAESL